TRRHVCLLSARYEGFDARVESLVTREVSLGDFVLMGGELPALCLVEAVARLLPGALGDEESHGQDSFASGLLDYPQYTRPAEFRGMAVPEVLLSGHHGMVAAWRRREALRRTLLLRPDLLEAAQLSDEDLKELERLRAELAAPSPGEPRAGADGGASGETAPAARPPAAAAGRRGAPAATRRPGGAPASLRVEAVDHELGDVEVGVGVHDEVELAGLVGVEDHGVAVLRGELGEHRVHGLDRRPGGRLDLLAVALVDGV